MHYVYEVFSIIGGGRQGMGPGCWSAQPDGLQVPCLGCLHLFFKWRMRGPGLALGLIVTQPPITASQEVAAAGRKRRLRHTQCLPLPQQQLTLWV